MCCRNVGAHLDNDERVAHLAAVTSAAESAFVHTLLTRARDTWIGIFYAFEIDPDPRMSLDPGEFRILFMYVCTADVSCESCSQFDSPP